MVMFYTFLLLSILFHILDDFVLQPICLSNLKQKQWWKDKVADKFIFYQHDYKMALMNHSLSWSIMIILPYILIIDYNDLESLGIVIMITVIINTVVHYIIDNAKANLYSINLLTDQLFHYIQIFITNILLYNFIN